jgi:hypothetical protein
MHVAVVVNLKNNVYLLQIHALAWKKQTFGINMPYLNYMILHKFFCRLGSILACLIFGSKDCSHQRKAKCSFHIWWRQCQQLKRLSNIVLISVAHWKRPERWTQRSHTNWCQAAAKQTRRFSTTNIRWLLLFREIMFVLQPISTPRG